MTMDSDKDYEFDVNAEMSLDESQSNKMGRKEPHSSSTSENGEDYNSPTVLSPIRTMDIPSVRRPPVSATIPTDRVSAHDLPLAETLSAVKGGLFHIILARPSADFGTILQAFNFRLIAD